MIAVGISVCVFLLIFYEYASATGQVKIALAAQGKAAEIGNWVKMVSLMKHQRHISLFILSYDAPVDLSHCVSSGATHVSCLYLARSSWTSGRNYIANEIVKKENSIHHHFKYWIMCDHDQIVISRCGKSSNCGEKFSPNSLEFAACCFDGIVGKLMEPSVQYPVVHFSTLFIEEICSKDYATFMHFDCGDAMLYAYHRLAVPVMFPYIELLDRKSWWESQGIHFHLVSACFTGYSVYSNLVCGYGSSIHSGYPQGRFPVESNKAIEQVYGKVGLVSPQMIHLNTPSLEQGILLSILFSVVLVLINIAGNCAKLPANTSTYTNFIEPRDSSFLSSGWQNSSNFRKCHMALQPRFIKFLETGDLSKIDGEVY